MISVECYQWIEKFVFMFLLFYLSGFFGTAEQRKSCGCDIVLSRAVCKSPQDDTVSMQPLFPGKLVT
jgi:hypothetical protein